MGTEEMKFIREAFKSNYIVPLGPQVDAFEKEVAEYIGIPYTLALSSGTAAIHLAMRLLGVGINDEVIASTLTFIGSVTPAVFQGAKLTFVDCDRVSWNISADLLETALKDSRNCGRTVKAVIPTDLYGQCADYRKILAVSKKYGVPVVIDAAEAMGARYHNVHAGVGGDAAVFSFNGNKIITTSGGGILASKDKDFIEHARKLSQQAREAFPYYEHSEIGYNYRLSNILAAIGRGQLRVLNRRLKRKKEIFDYYKKSLSGLPGIEFIPESPYGESNHWLTVILITKESFGVDRETLRLALEKANVESRPVWKPMHLQPVFQGKSRVFGGEVAEDLFCRGLCLPSGTALTNADLNRIIDIIVQCHRHHRECSY